MTLRKGWEVKKLGDVCLKVTDGSHNPPKGVENSDYIMLSSKNIFNNLITFDEPRYLTKEDFEQENARTLVSTGDVLLTIVGTIGRAAVVENESKFTLQRSVAVLKPDERQLFSRFLMFLLQSSIGRLTEGARGVAQKGIYLKQLREMLFSIPPLSEQQRIVDILDQAFEAIDTAIANTQQAISNAKELFDTELNRIFSQGGEGWEVKKLGEVCIVQRGSSPRPIKSYLTTESSGVNWIKIGDTKNDQKYISATSEKITHEGSLQSRYVVEGDFILTNSMSFGRPYIMKTTGCIHDGWFVLRLNETINTDYFYYLLSSNFVQKQFQLLASGAIVKNISSDLVKKAVLPIPNIESQKQLVNTIERLQDQTQALTDVYQQKLVALQELKQSLLHKAFTGELTAHWQESA